MTVTKERKITTGNVLALEKWLILGLLFEYEIKGRKIGKLKNIFLMTRNR